MLNTDREEKVYVDQFEAQVANKWIYELEKIDLYDTDFWVKHRKYFQKEIFEIQSIQALRIVGTNIEQLVEYEAEVGANIKKLDSVIQLKEDEFVFIYWWF